MFDAGNGPRALSGNSFRELVRRDGELLSNELGQIMTHFGITKPMLPHDEIVKKSVRARLELLHGMDASKSFNQLVDQFASQDFEVREQASRMINQKYDLYLSLISQKLKEPSVTPEVKIRLNRIVKQNARANQISDVIRGFELLDSAEYLIQLAEESVASKTDPDLPVFVASRLKELTGQDFGNDLAGWKKWVNANRKVVEK